MRVLFVAQLALFVVDACIDVSEDSVGDDKVCYDNVAWAKETGITQNAAWYTDYEGIANTSSDADFQCILHANVGPGGGSGWKCKLPCTSTLSACTVASEAASTEATTVEPDSASSSSSITTATPTSAIVTDATTTAVPTSANATTNATTTTAASGSSGSNGSSGSLEWWGWLLLVLALLLCAAAAYFLLAGGSKKGAQKKKKTRATKTAAPAEPLVAAPLVEPQQDYVTTAPPVYVTTAPQYQTAPVYQQVAPAYQYSAPVAGSSFVMANPVQTMSTPIATYGVQPGAVYVS